jgi:hypothetical protein
MGCIGTTPATREIPWEWSEGTVAVAMRHERRRCRRAKAAVIRVALTGPTGRTSFQIERLEIEIDP